MMKFLLVLLLLNVQPSADVVSGCPNTNANGETKPVYVLTLLSIPEALTVLSGHRIARDEINNRTDLLPGYHIELIVDTVEGCSSPEAGLGLSNLLKYTLNPPCHPVVAVAGLGCSSHTSVLSPVAGGDGFDLIQLSSANSPIFETQNNHFPHLWRFLGSAIVYSDTVLAIMDQYNWTRIGIVYNMGSSFNSEIAEYLAQNLKSNSKIITFSFGIRGTNKFYLDTAISDIKRTETTILVSLLNAEQTEALLHQALAQNLVYPRYTWIHIEQLQHMYKFNNVDHAATRGHMYLQTQALVDCETVLVSGETLETFNRKCDDNIQVLKQMCSDKWPSVSSLNPAYYWYDQIWGLALALNKSLPILRDKNLTIDNYTIGQNNITEVIEEQMANLSFQGAGGWVEFNEYRAVSTPVEVYWLDHGKQELVRKLEHVGIYNPLNPSDFHVHINVSKLPNDTLYRRYEFLLIPRPVAILMYILTGAVIIFTTIQLIVYLYYREHKTIKATSPYLSLLMFAGCYLLCLSVVLTVTRSSFITSPRTFSIIICFSFTTSFNGASLILFTLLLKLLRVKHIFSFSSRLRSHLGKCWSNVSLFFIIILLILIINFILVFLLIFQTPAYERYSRNPTDLIVQVHIRPAVLGSLTRFGILSTYSLIFMLIIVYVAIRTRKMIPIEYNNFKDTSKINCLISLLLVSFFITATAFIILSQTHREVEGNVVFIYGFLFIPTLCQLVLFTTKLVPVVIEKFLHNKVLAEVLVA